MYEMRLFDTYTRLGWLDGARVYAIENTDTIEGMRGRQGDVVALVTVEVWASVETWRSYISGGGPNDYHDVPRRREVRTVAIGQQWRWSRGQWREMQ